MATKRVGLGERYFLDRDNSGHWYLVKAANRDDWYQWTELPEDDEESWDPPSFATRLDGSPSRVTFSNPEQEP